eukprot:CAMPEP_0197825520 /NCGR_PEP_ID=MMETSP1437-20131217/2578_1 /TAXON_ID=49252 ORGANISM="Eucampia antarctica, Strain CCMP1452" /NCGR_SAMPLE_ID=MMETSP1437 /ASSEMBLY_ACC=CAM_ASM_001096 /LENGTH=253 /DNA_ID=CAMNT_0043425537 /DNA_START=63 /DNA_END=824 /DNA_ORIENTATION=+
MVALRITAVLVVVCCSYSTAFVIPTPWATRQYSHSCLFSSPNDSNEDPEESLSFTDAEQALKAEEEEKRMESRGNEDGEDKRKFDANKNSYDDMRAKIRARASEMGVEKSVATVEAIKAATNRAQAGESAKENQVDLSKFGADFLDSEEDELTDEQKKEIDPVSQASLIDQVMNEVKNTRFPTTVATLKQASLMVTIFLVTAGLILKVDEVLRIQITDWGFIPRPNDIGDYSDLALPEGFTELMNDADLEKLN